MYILVGDYLVYNNIRYMYNMYKMVNQYLSSISKISDNIYLSGMNHNMSNNISQEIKLLNIKYIISCTPRQSVAGIHDTIMYENPKITILYLPYMDVLKQNLWMTNNNNVSLQKYPNTSNDVNQINILLDVYNNKPMIEIAYHFINSALSNGNPVLIHCVAGISRSVSILAYYLMKKYDISFDEAMIMIKKYRPIANPNDSFRQQLIDYEKKREKYTTENANRSMDSVFARRYS